MKNLYETKRKELYTMGLLRLRDFYYIGNKYIDGPCQNSQNVYDLIVRNIVGTLHLL